MRKYLDRFSLRSGAPFRSLWPLGLTAAVAIIATAAFMTTEDRTEPVYADGGHGPWTCEAHNDNGDCTIWVSAPHRHTASTADPVSAHEDKICTSGSASDCDFDTLMTMLNEANDRDLIGSHIIGMFTKITANIIAADTGETRAEVIDRISTGDYHERLGDPNDYSWICEAQSSGGDCQIYGKAPPSD